MRGPHLVALSLLLSVAGLCCGPSRARFAPPEGAPEPPEGAGWFCAHAITPHDVSWCKRKRDACEKYHKRMIQAKREFLEVPERAPHSSRMRPETAPVAGPGGGDDELPESEEPPVPEPPSQELEGICELDPSACPSVSPRSSVPTYSNCAPRPNAFCTAYYHEFNFYRRDKENEWRHFCAETREACEAWREDWHLHLVKRPCEEVR
ncbi:hypothetical protein [Polyangium mundeleinium]|uniref:Uncharacterized protein n=1 Tax=Polyangium mundeleinium TaxID=2995306 RepID=A0ABT5F076_9BACT|nr:hypothetical protein [Polyangium mundeleinium]MDC0747497.1 hypothetical protein [Polyangium mundeleinium]